MYIGHKREDGAIQTLNDHLTNVSRMAGVFARPFDAEACARRAGLLHDAGKYSPAGQARMKDPEHTPKVDHSTAGARIALEKCRDGLTALAVVGHHGGMPDYGGRLSTEGDGSLCGRCKKDLSGNMDYSAYWSENHIDIGPLLPQWLMTKPKPFAIPFFTRILFSCLVDADFLDTEQFMRGEMPRGGHSDMNELLARLNGHIQPWLDAPKTQINEKRCEILRDCMAAGEEERGLFSLTVPTGGGKTVSSLAFALTHAVKHGLDRVIYVIPYTSIIEQNAAVFKSILGENNVIEHHSGVEYDSDKDMEKPDVMRRVLATENWDAPVIVTTAVQFFESLFSNKPSRCRKLHNIANSVVVFDEAQMLPLPYLKPCVAAIAELVRYYYVTAVLCTATQPSLNRFFIEYGKGLEPREICGNVAKLQNVFRRVHFEREQLLNTEKLAQSLARRERVLCIVNTRQSAQDIFARLPEQGSYHLSTRMTPEHRSKVLEEIRGRLLNGKPCRVVSTSLVEAGVDVDFPEVWREMAGLDSILQAAGRCNREGRNSAEASAVVVFTLDRGVPKGMQPNAVAAEVAIQDAEHLDDSATIRRYFEQLYWQKGNASLDAKCILDMCPPLKMKTMAEAFHLIESDTRTIYIPTDENADDIEMLRAGRLSRGLIRRMGRSAVSVYPWDWGKLEEVGAIEKITENCAILSDLSLYDAKCGLKVDVEPGKGLWI